MSWKKEGVKKIKREGVEVKVRPAHLCVAVIHEAGGEDHIIPAGGEMWTDGDSYEIRTSLGRVVRFFNPNS
jgi:hypothetical protein